MKIRTNPLTIRIKKINSIGICALACGLLMIPAPSFAHHGIAAYQEAKEITVTGSVTYFDFVNPTL